VDVPVPSPKFHDHVLLHPDVDMFVEDSVTVQKACFFLPDNGVTEKAATGGVQAADAFTGCETEFEPPALVTVSVML
jgi:hypothetical protein